MEQPYMFSTKGFTYHFSRKLKFLWSRTMCLLTLRSTDNKDGTIQQDDPPTSCKDGRQDFNIQQFSSIEESEREASTSYIKTPCSIRKKLEAAINHDRSLNADAVEDEDLDELRATLESADDNLKTQMLQNETNNLKEDHPKFEMEIYEIIDKMCLLTSKQTSNTDGDVQQMNQLIPSKDCTTGLQLRLISNNYHNKECIYQQPALQYRAAFQHKCCDTFFERVIRKEQEKMSISKLYEKLIKERLVGQSVLEGIVRILKGLKTQKRTIKTAKERYKRKILEEILEMNQGVKELKKHIRQLFLMLLLIILLKNTCENIKCKQSSCRKYPCLNSILYLLWQSGDVEVNPGPPAKSTTYRNWLYDVCPTVRKDIAGVSTDCKMNKIWQQKPENWPPKELYFNPRSKGHSVNNVEDLLINLLHCCDNTSKLSHDISSEIDTWNAHRSMNNGKLLHLYRTRKCCMSIEQVNRSLNVLQSHLSSYHALITEGNTCIRISFSCQPAIDQKIITHNIYRAEATRKISSFLCRILHGKDPERKCDHIWTLTPDGWPSHLRYYNPNNGGERCAENEDDMVVEALITLCEKKSIIFPTSYQDMVNAWQAGDQMLLSKLLTRHAAETNLKKAVMKLHKEGLLQEVDEHLRELGILVQCDGSTKNSKSQKRKMVNVMNKHEIKITKQSDHEEAVESTIKELLPGCSIGQLLDNQSDSLLLDKISQNLPDCLVDEADDIQFHWNE